METNILMESGTNELEVLEFTVGNNHYGINVAKIKEIVQYSPVTPVPNSMCRRYFHAKRFNDYSRGFGKGY